MTRRAALATLLAVGAALLAGGCPGSDPEGPALPPLPVTPEMSRPFTVRWDADEADLPWNRTLYVHVADGDRRWEVLPLVFVPGQTETTAAGRAGLQWRILSEVAPDATMRRILWMVDAEGRFQDGVPVVLAPPARPHIVVTGDDTLHPGPDTLTVADETGGARLVARRDHLTGTRLAFWDSTQPPAKEAWRAAKLSATTRPWTFHEVREGRFVVAVQCRGRQWEARRVELRAGETVHFDVLAQPPGGGTVICEDGRAELLLGSDLPVPSLRITDPVYRAVWEGVPPGTHSVRWPDGTTREIEVQDGAEVRLPKRP